MAKSTSTVIKTASKPRAATSTARLLTNLNLETRLPRRPAPRRPWVLLVLGPGRVGRDATPASTAGVRATRRTGPRGIRRASRLPLGRPLAANHGRCADVLSERPGCERAQRSGSDPHPTTTTLARSLARPSGNSSATARQQLRNSSTYLEARPTRTRSAPRERTVTQLRGKTVLAQRKDTARCSRQMTAVTTSLDFGGGESDETLDPIEDNANRAGAPAVVEDAYRRREHARNQSMRARSRWTFGAMRSGVTGG